MKPGDEASGHDSGMASGNSPRIYEIKDQKMAVVTCRTKPVAKIVRALFN
jgi:hypothetical protein